jgi:glycerophosphoryl diester phosphodiesterase
VGSDAGAHRVIGFAHRGAPLTRGDENSLPAFARALALGASGLESDIGLRADGVPILAHTGLSLRRRLRPVRPSHVPSLAELYDRCGHAFELSLDMTEPEAAEVVVRLAEERGAADRLWLTYWHLERLERWRLRWPHVHLVFATMPLRQRGFESLVERLAAGGVDAVNIHHRLWRERLIHTAHDRGLRAFAWGIRRRGPLRRVLARGVDAVYCDDVEEMVRALSVGPLARTRPDD